MNQQKRNKQILLRLSEEELEQLNENVGLTVFSREEYIRQLLNGNTPFAFPPGDYRQMVYQIKRIGYNIDQLAKVAHTRGFIDSQEYKRQAEMLFDLCKKLSDIPTYIEGLRDNGYL